MTGISPQEIGCGFLTIRGQSVLVGATIADLYGVSTKAVKNFYHLTNLKFSAPLFGAFAEKGRYLLETVLQRRRMRATAIPELLIS